MSKYEDISIGDHASIRHVITQKDISDFVNLSGDDNKIHVDSDFAAKTFLKKPVAHGMIGASFISTIIGTKIPGDGALWFSQSLEFLKPVRVGDEILIEAKVIKKIDRDKVIELETTVKNQHEQICTTGIAKVKVVEFEIPALAKLANEIKVENKAVLVTGATGGIGREVCLQIAKAGFDVIVSYRSNEKLAQDLKNEIIKIGRKAYLAKADLTIEDDVVEISNIIKRREVSFQGIVHCATPKLFSLSVLDVQYKDVIEHLDSNLKSLIFMVKHLVPFMIANKYGKIVVLSTQAIDQTTSGMSHYIAAKAAMVGFAKSMALELGPKGIRVNIVSPGMTDTDLISELPQKAKLMVEATSPIRRLARPEDVALAISYLISPGSDYVNGENLRVNGGQVML